VTGFSAAAIAGLGAGCGTTASPPSPTTTTSPPTTTQLTPSNPAVAGGAGLFVTDGCSACHSLSGAPGIGPSLAGVSDQPLTLDDGRRVLATSAFIRETLLHPARQPIKGYSRELMALATARLRLGAHPRDVAALVAFIESTQ
jgi:mono/diheme cytochrome c family protein